MKSYYGDNRRKLIEIKKKYDPKNIFRYRQSIPVGKICSPDHLF